VKKAILLTCALLCFLTVFPTTARCDKKDVLKALEVINGNVESETNLSKDNDLLADAKVAINIGKITNQDRNFVDAAEQCLACDIKASAYWSMSIEFKKTHIIQRRS